MIYPDSLEKKIGFDGVRRHIASLCISPIGADRCEEMDFLTDYRAVKEHLSQTAEMLAIIQGDSEFPIANIHDRRAALLALRVPGTWPAETDLAGLRNSLATMSAIRTFFNKVRNDQTNTTPYPALDRVAADLISYNHVMAELDRIVDRHGQIKDNASPQLSEIRRALSAASAGISAAMRRVMAAAVRDGYLESDATPTVRDGRLVIPVAPMYKRKIQGIVHDESASGKTVFIEPAEVVAANNRIRELAADERREIIKILQAFADFIRPDIDSLIGGFDLLGTFDFIHAKARYAQIVEGQMPSLADRPEIEWYHACHPGLKLSLERHGKKIVPLDITLIPEKRLLIISGPNAGGKSVTLKTVAIVQYMAQCGVLPPVYTNSHMGIFESIFIDIGDDQSIEDDLSTYSSHLKNMKFFLARGNARTLALIDEFGSGTEPQIGGAIAQALLRQFNDKGMWGVITTHYHNLKQFAEETPGLVNGSMLYDRQAMQPLFRLAVGHPGSSFAIEIARKTGLPEEIIADASEIVGSDYINLDKYLLDIARDRRYWENKRAEIRKKEKQLEETLQKYSDDLDELRAQRKEIIGEARQEAKRILDSSNATIERTIRDIRTAQADKEKTRIAREQLSADRKALSSEKDAAHPVLDKKLPKKKDAPKPKPTTTQQIEVGSSVTLGEANTVGTVESISGKNAVVVFGQLKTTVKLNRLRLTDRKPQQPKGGVSYISAQTSAASRERQLNFSTELDVRGMRADEAVQAVMYYIDDALQFNTSRVRILHGTGTGALRQVIRQYLDTVGAVSNFHDEDVRLGGTGITVVEF